MTTYLPRLADLLDPPAWHQLALCAETDPEAFYPEVGSNGAAAKRICARCEVREACLRDALERDEPWGIYGGLSAEERRRRQAEEQRAA